MVRATARKPEVVRPKFNLGKILPPKGQPFYLRVAGGQRPREDGVLCMDSAKTPQVDYVHDPLETPWPIDNSVIDRIGVEYFLYKLDGKNRIKFVNECWRVLKKDGQLLLREPYYSSMRGISDPLATFPGICEWSFVYFNKEWREKEKVINEADYKCDFDFGYGHDEDADIKPRNDDYRALARKHWLNSINDLHVTMTARK